MGYNLVRHQAVLGLLEAYISRQEGGRYRCVPSVISLSRFTRSKWPWQWLAAALVNSSNHFPAFNHTPSGGTGVPGKVVGSYIIDGQRETVPAVLSPVSSENIHRHYLHCMRTIEAYGSGGGNMGPRNSKRRLTDRL